MNKRFSFLWSLVCMAVLLHAQAPAGYYAPAKGKKGSSLKTALYAIITDHTARSYDNLWTDFRKTDARADGKVWDMYSSITNYTFGNDQAGNYKREGDVYNREHSFPKSWFDDAKPMYTDLFHLYPTDGYVNGRRSNYPFGETKNPTWTSSGGHSKLGPSSVAGYSGTVFEPADEYKGDFARTYFYMATCYENLIAGWNSPMLAGNRYPAYTEWAIRLLLKWAEEDPVSQKEIDRNNAVYGIQHNRNPYIDYPGLEQYVWGSKTSTAFDPDNYEGGGGNPDVPGTEVQAPVFSPVSGVVEAGTTVTVSCPTQGAYICFSVNNGEEQVLYPPVSLVIDETTTVTARAVLGDKESESVTANYTVASGGEEGEGVYVKVTDHSQLVNGAKYIIVCEKYGRALSGQGKDIRSYAEVTVSDNRVVTATGSEGYPYALTLVEAGGKYSFHDAASGCYLALTSSANKLHTATDNSAEEAQWTVTFSGGFTPVYNAKYTDRRIQYNASSPRFACYTGSQQDVSLYVSQRDITGISLPFAGEGRVDVLTLDGRMVRSRVPVEKALKGLPRGIYVVGGTKVLVR